MGATDFDDSQDFFSEARKSLTNIGTMTLSIQLFTRGSSGLFRGETSFGAAATLEQFRSLRLIGATNFCCLALLLLAHDGVLPFWIPRLPPFHGDRAGIEL
jgi:hypothetical protein